MKAASLLLALIALVPLPAGAVSVQVEAATDCPARRGRAFPLHVRVEGTSALQIEVSSPAMITLRIPLVQGKCDVVAPAVFFEEPTSLDWACGDQKGRSPMPGFRFLGDDEVSVLPVGSSIPQRIGGRSVREVRIAKLSATDLAEVFPYADVVSLARGTPSETWFAALDAGTGVVVPAGERDVLAQPWSREGAWNVLWPDLPGPQGHGQDARALSPMDGVWCAWTGLSRNVLAAGAGSAVILGLLTGLVRRPSTQMIALLIGAAVIASGAQWLRYRQPPTRVSDGIVVMDTSSTWAQDVWTFVKVGDARRVGLGWKPNQRLMFSNSAHRRAMSPVLITNTAGKPAKWDIVLSRGAMMVVVRRSFGPAMALPVQPAATQDVFARMCQDIYSVRGWRQSGTIPVDAVGKSPWAVGLWRNLDAVPVP